MSPCKGFSCKILSSISYFCPRFAFITLGILFSAHYLSDFLWVLYFLFIMVIFSSDCHCSWVQIHTQKYMYWCCLEWQRELVSHRITGSSYQTLRSTKFEVRIADVPWSQTRCDACRLASVPRMLICQWQRRRFHFLLACGVSCLLLTTLNNFSLVD